MLQDLKAPSEAQMAHLPRWACVALAGRCACAALEIFKQNWTDPKAEIVEGVPALWAMYNAAEWTQRSAEETKYPGHFGHTDDHDYFLGTLVRSTQESGFRIVCKAAMACHEALYSAGLYGASGPSAAAQHAAKAAAALIEAAEYSTNRTTTIRQVFSDYELLIEVSKRERWNHNTAVARRFFSLDAPIERQIAFAINDLCVELCKLIAKDQNFLIHIEWRLLEHVVATSLSGLGFDVELTPPSKDGGKDVVAQCMIRGRKSTYYIEIKHWRSGKKVDMDPVRYFLEVNVRDGTDGGLFLATSGYTQAVISQLSEITRKRIKLRSTPTVVSLCQHFVQDRGHATWRPRDVLPAVLFENTIKYEDA